MPSEHLMSDLLSARSQMGLSLAFHIIFAVLGVSLPLMMTIAEGLWLRTREPVYHVLARRWAKGTAILLAVGAVSGTVLSFELGLLWPRFMEKAGSVVGMPFSLEGFAFFTEAIFLGIYLYGWDKTPEFVHLLSGVIVSISGAVSAVFVTCVNAWMNTPTGFTLANGQFTEIEPFKAMFAPAAIPEAVHMLLAAYCAVGFAAAGIHSWLMLRRGRNRFDEVALGIALAVGGLAVLAQGVSGDALARMVASTQSTKLASLEGQFQTESGAPLRLGGLPDVKQHRTRYALEIPHGLSLLAFHTPNATIKGLDAFPEKDWPPVLWVHIFFQVMVGLGSALSLVALLGGWLRWKRNPVSAHRGFLKLLVLSTPLGFLALEAGWMVTELGRQPWIIAGILRTEDAVTRVPHLQLPFLLVSALYCALGVIVVWLLAAHVIGDPNNRDADAA
jgi:cytochrome bd ubiquinol oxidase subunit I